MSNRPLIFVTNDDGVNAEGIHRLAECVMDMGEVVMVAPDGPRSGGSASLTVGQPLRVTAHGKWKDVTKYSINGTPVDCVKLGLSEVIDRRPDVVLSGINHGANAGNSVVYSGTMGAAFEGTLQGIPSIGFSLIPFHPTDAEFESCRKYIRELVANAIENGAPDDMCLNVNFPGGGNIKGIKKARCCRGRWVEEYKQYKDPFDQSFYMLTGSYKNMEPESTDTDLYWLDRGYASISPVCAYRDMYDPCADEFLSKCNTLFKNE